MLDVEFDRPIVVADRALDAHRLVEARQRGREIDVADHPARAAARIEEAHFAIE